MSKSKNSDLITFPKHEHDWYRKEIAAGRPVWTSRLDKEFGKYKVGEIYESEFGTLLKVIEVNRERFSKNHPNYAGLTRTQKNQLKKAVLYDHVRLQPVIPLEEK